MRIFKLTHTVLLLTLITGCSSFEKKTTATADLQQSKVINVQLSQKVNDATTQVEQDYLKAKDENFAYYAPNTWQSIERNLLSARKLINRFDPNNQGFFGGPSETTVLTSIKEVSDKLKQAQNTKNQVLTFLAKPLADIEYLTPKINDEWKKEFASINQDLNQLIDTIDAGYTVEKQQNSRKRLQTKIHDLEINIVTANYYSPLKQQFSHLNRQLIPQSYNAVSQGLQQLNGVIAASPRDTAALTAAANAVKNDIQSAEHVTTDVKWINNLDKKQREEIVLQYRASIEKLGHKFLDQDLSNLSYKAQVSTFERELSAQLGEFITKDIEVTKAADVEADTTPRTATPAVNN